MHPTPWSCHRVFDAFVIYDADGDIVETVYGRANSRGVDPLGENLAMRIVQAVNEAGDTGPPTVS